jgi:hypothetical protein
MGPELAVGCMTALVKNLVPYLRNLELCNPLDNSLYQGFFWLAAVLRNERKMTPSFT